MINKHRDGLCITNKSLYKQIRAGQTLKNTAAERMTSDIDGRWVEIDALMGGRQWEVRRSLMGGAMTLMGLGTTSLMGGRNTGQ